MWYAGDSKIQELAECSKKKFGIELPLVTDILHLSSFCWGLATFFDKKRGDSVQVELQSKESKNALLRWIHPTFYGTRTETLELPEDAIWEIHGNLLESLNEKCEQLADMCGWYKDHPEVEHF